MLLNPLKFTDFFLSLIFDAAKYMVAASAILKSLYSELFHVTCTAHLLHKRGMKVKSHFEDVDQIIAKAKSGTVKNKIRQVKFDTVGCPLQPVATRWGS